MSGTDITIEKFVCHEQIGNLNGESSKTLQENKIANLSSALFGYINVVVIVTEITSSPHFLCQ